MECSICNKKIAVDEGAEGQPPQEKKAKFDAEEGVDDSCVKCPCGHDFHKSCLTNWFEQNVSKVEQERVAELEKRLLEKTEQWLKKKFEAQYFKKLATEEIEEDGTVSISLDDEEMSEEDKQVWQKLQDKWILELPNMGDEEDEWEATPEQLEESLGTGPLAYPPQEEEYENDQQEQQGNAEGNDSDDEDYEDEW